MRILASGDHHFDERSTRWAECINVHSWMVDLARAEKVDLSLSGGDIYERASTPMEREAVAEYKVRMAEVCPDVTARGNHDRHLDIEILSKLKSHHPIIVQERAGLIVVAGAAVATMAWPETSYLLAQHRDDQVADLAVRGALCSTLRGLGDGLALHDGPRILLGHFMVDGCVTSVGQPMIGKPVNVGLADLALAGAHLGLMSHIHKGQHWDIAGNPHYYMGSPFRTNYGERERKTVLLAEFDGARLVSVQEIDTPCARMIHVDAVWDGDALRFELDEPIDGAEIRIRYDVARDQRERADRAARELLDTWKAQGATQTKAVEQVTVESRARAPEVAAANTIPEKVTALWNSSGYDPGARRESLSSKAHQLQQEVQAMV